MQKTFKNYALVLLLTSVLILPQVASAAWWNPFSWRMWNKVFHFQRTEQGQGRISPSPSSPVFCTQDAKQCPDGSYVGRQGPKCEFKPCPTTLPTAIPYQIAGWKTYKNDEYGFKFEYNPKYKLIEKFNEKEGPNDSVGRSYILIGNYSNNMPAAPEYNYQVTIKKGINSLEELKNYFMQPNLAKNITTSNINFLGQQAVEMKFHQEVGPAWDVRAIGIVRNNTAFIISEWHQNKNYSETEFNQMLSTFRFTK